MNLDLILDAAVAGAALADGATPAWLARQGIDPRLLAAQADRAEVTRQQLTNPNAGSPQWTAAEDAAILANHLQMDDAQLADMLGRTEVAVKIRRQRRLALTSMRLANADLMPASAIGALLGVDQKAPAMWVQRGLLPAAQKDRMSPWIFQRSHVLRWAVRPANWIYFDPARVTDPALAALLVRQAARWGDAWWTPGQVAAYHGVSPNDVNRLLRRGEIAAVRWGNWRILRSEATRPDLVFYKGEGSGKYAFTERYTAADGVCLLAAAVGLNSSQIARLGAGEGKIIAHRLLTLRTRGLLPAALAATGLDGVLEHDPASGLLYADWRLYRHRLPSLGRAMGRYAAGQPLTADQVRLCFAVLRHGLAWWGRGDAELSRWAHGLQFAAGMATRGTCDKVRGRLAGLGVDVLE